MPKKGVEPPALRRFRLAHRRKRSARRSSRRVRSGSSRRHGATKVRHSRRFSMARRRSRRRHGGSRKLPILTLAAVAIPIADAVTNSGGNIVSGLNRYLMDYTGIDAVNRQFVPSQAIVGLGPLLA